MTSLIPIHARDVRKYCTSVLSAYGPTNTQVSKCLRCAFCCFGFAVTDHVHAKQFQWLTTPLFAIMQQDTWSGVLTIKLSVIRLSVLSYSQKTFSKQKKNTCFRWWNVRDDMCRICRRAFWCWFDVRQIIKQYSSIIEIREEYRPNAIANLYAKSRCILL